MTTINVWPRLGTTVTLASGYVVTAAGAVAVLTDEILALLAVAKLLTFDPTFANPNPSPIPPSTSGGGIAAATSAALSTAISLAPDTLYATQGAVSANDKGGGSFYFVPGSSDTVDGALTLTATGGRLKRILSDGVINVKWFGAVGDGVADDTAAIQAAVNACQSYSGGPFFPRGAYRITDTIKCGLNYNGIEGVTFRGELAMSNLIPSVDFATTTYIVWDGASSTSPAIWLSGANFKTVGLGVYVKSGRTLYSAWEFGNLTAAQVFNTRSTWEYCTATVQDGAPTANLQHGWTIGTKYPASGNLENCKWHGCYINDARMWGFLFASGQPYSTKIQNCCIASPQAAATGTFRGLGIAFNTIGDIEVDTCEFQQMEHVFYVNNGTNFNVHGGGAEKCKRIYESANPGISGVPACFSLKNFRMNNTYVGLPGVYLLAGDHLQINANGGEVVDLQGVYVDDVSQPSVISIQKGCTLLSQGNSFCAPGFAVLDTDGGTRVGGIWSKGDRQLDAGAPAGSQVVSLPTYEGGLNPSYAGALSTISGAATSIAVTLPQSEYFTDYKVRLQVESVTGSPAAGAFTPYITSKSATGFTITVPVAPGGGTSIVFRYTVYR